MKAEEAQKVADAIVTAAERKYGNAPYGERGEYIDTIISSAEDWRALIAAWLQGLSIESVGGPDLDCPFCGDKMFIKWAEAEPQDDGLDCWNAGCKPCGYTMMATPGLGKWPEDKDATKAQLIALVNSRALPSACGDPNGEAVRDADSDEARG